MKYSISVKGIVWEKDRVWLRKNERSEWELPGGKIDPDEQPAETVIREIQEELGLSTSVVSLVDVGMLSISTDSSLTNVLIISYLLIVKKRVSSFEFEGEAGKAEFQLCTLEEIENLRVPDIYKQSIKKSLML